MKNPLLKRLPRILKEECGKYLVIFLFMAGTIGFISGFLVADGSMIAAYHNSFTDYRIEDGNFELSAKADEELIEALEAQGTSVFPNYYIEEETDINDSTLRIFENRTEIDLVCVMEGTLPEKADEIGIDRMYADNNGISVGDIIRVGEKEMKVSALVALSDYSALFSDNTDMMFDSIKFGVAVVTPEGFQSLGESRLHYNYSWLYDEKPVDENEAKVKGDEFLEALAVNVALRSYILSVMGGKLEIKNFVPEYANQAIHFTGDDMGGDKVMMTALLYILMVILAFVFAVTTSNTISMEARTIGALRASGYTKRELVCHYMTLPVMVTLAAAAAGNVLGYTFFKDICVGMYYGSYSLPTYETVWNAEAFVLTTIVPLLIMAAVNLAVLVRKLSLSPLQFLRVDLTRRRRKRAVRLPELGFFQRFRIRIILQNSTIYITLFVGIIFANLLLMFGLIFPSMLKHYQGEIENSMIAQYQYLLKEEAKTKDADAERYAAYSLETLERKGKNEAVTVYGILPESKYQKLDFTGQGVYVSEGMAEKFSLKEGDVLTLKECYEDKEYEMTVAGTCYYPAAMAVFMSTESFNETFGKENGYFNGYFSDRELTDLDDASVAAVITQEDLTKLSRQLMVSMGSMMDMVNVFAVVMFAIIIYLLSKIVIEKNASNISMVKILGFDDGEIGRLYILSTTIVVIASVLISLPLVNTLMKWIFYYYIMEEMSGWFSYYVSSDIFVKMMIAGVVSYAAVALFQYRKIRRVPMDEALKNVE